MFSRPAKRAVRVGLLTAWLLLAACFPPALQPTPIAVEPTVTIAPFATPVPTRSPTPMAIRNQILPIEGDLMEESGTPALACAARYRMCSMLALTYAGR